MTYHLQHICVFCGSRPGKSPAFIEATKALGQAMAQNQQTLIYGGGNVGLMGTLADTVLANQGQVIGVIPEFLVFRELAHDHLAELHIVQSMHERKAKMAELADAFIALPGGLGTLDELFEIMTWSQLHLHQKRIGILNTEGYFDALLAFLDHAQAAEFIPDVSKLIVVHDTPEGLLAALATHKPEDKTQYELG